MRIESFDLRQQPEYTTALITCYQEVFRAPPWNEEWWTDALVHAELTRYDHAQAARFLALEQDRVIGFAWGGVFEPRALEIELGITLPGCGGEVLYLKDIGVCAEYRNRGLAKQLLTSLVYSLGEIAQTPRCVAARTMGPPEPSILFDWFRRDYAFTVAAAYPAPDNRVVLAQELNGFMTRV